MPQVVADRVLLARLVLIREELRALHQRAKERQAGREFTGGGGDGSGVSGGGAAPAAAAGVEARGGHLYGPDEPAAAARAGASSGAGGAGEEDDIASIASDSAAVDAAAADDGGFFSFHRGNVPRRCAAFVQALLGVGEAPRRLALLRKVRAARGDGWNHVCHSTMGRRLGGDTPGCPNCAANLAGCCLRQ